jgi:hypothetical protein
MGLPDVARGEPCRRLMTACDPSRPFLQGGWLQSESVAGLRRNRWLEWIGITGCFASESASERRRLPAEAPPGRLPLVRGAANVLRKFKTDRARLHGGRHSSLWAPETLSPNWPQQSRAVAGVAVSLCARARGRVSVVIPTLNEADRLGPLLGTLQGEPGLEEIIVVDGGSADGTPSSPNASGSG